MRAVIYTRVSTDEQRDASHDDQARNCERVAVREELTMLRRYTDHGISGSRSDRPEYQRMLAAAKAHEFDVLLVDELSRFSRDQVECERAIRALEHINVRILGVSDGYDSRSKSRKVQRGVRGLINEVYLDDLADKTHRGLEGQALKGFSAGGKAYGYRPFPITDPARLDAYGAPAVVGYKREIVPEQAAIVREIYALYAAGKSARWLAAELNRRGVPSPGAAWKRTGKKRRDGKWLASTIHGDLTAGTGILGNPVYRGEYIWNRTQWVKNPETHQREARVRPTAEWVRVAMPELRIIDEELWQRVKARRAARTADNTPIDCRPKNRAPYRGVAGRRSKFVLSGLLKCAECGCSFVISDARNYACASHTNGGDAACGNRLRVRRDLVEAKVIGALLEELTRPESVEKFRLAIARQLRAAEKHSTAGTAERERRLAELDSEIGRMVDAVAGGLLSPTLRERLEAAETERARLRAAAEPQTARILAIVPDALARYARAVRDLPATLARDVDRARHALRRLLGEVKLRPDAERAVLVAELRIGAESLLRLVANGGPQNCAGSGGRI